MFDTGEKTAVSAHPAAHDAHLAPRLLVIDDDTIHRMIIGRLGSKAGYTVSEAVSYESAADVLRANAEFDCITLDLSLGQRSGHDLLNLMASQAISSRIIIISGADATVRAKTLQMGRALKMNVVDVLPKPVDLANLRTLFEHIRDRIDISFATTAA